MPLPRHIRKSELIRRNTATDLCDIAVGCQQFRREYRKRQRKIMFERNCSLSSSLSVVLSLSDVPKTAFSVNRNGGHKRGGDTALLLPVAMALQLLWHNG